MRRQQMLIGIAAIAAMAARVPAWAVTIADLTNSPLTYDGQTVTLTGRVELSLPARSESAYELRDGPRKVTVFSRQPPPVTGSMLSVTGTVHVFQEGELGEPESRLFPPLLIETSRAPAP
jgi:hypothetical protein